MKIALAALLALTPVSVMADEYQAGYSSSKTCFREEYREEYVPGTYNNPGYVKSWKIAKGEDDYPKHKHED